MMGSLGAKGFRPFFLVAAAYGALALPVWMLVWTGRIEPAGPLRGVAWHAHEMVHGFTLGVVAGFLLTAVSNWTQRETLTGGPLLALAGVWTAARLALVLVPGWWGPALDLVFIPGLVLGIGRPLAATGNRRNAMFPVLLGALWCTNLAIYADAAGLAPGLTLPASRVAVHLITAIIVAITGRVVPMFTRNATGAEGIANQPWLDRIAIGSVLLLALAEGLAPRGAVAAISAVAGAAVLGRAWRWGAQHTLGSPILWVLHLGHAAVGIGLLLGATRPWAPFAGSAPLHAVTVGGIGLLTVGMMARVSLGHTGRPIQVGWGMGAAFAAVAVAAAARVSVPWLLPARTLDALWLAAGLWALGFAAFVVLFAGVLVGPRVDGRPG